MQKMNWEILNNKLGSSTPSPLQMVCLVCPIILISAVHELHSSPHCGLWDYDTMQPYQYTGGTTGLG
jgi:hypothetical protein